MSEKTTKMLSMSDWLEIQQKFLDASRAFTQNIPVATATIETSRNPAIEAMEYWWKSISQFVPKENTELVTKILEQGKIYYTLGEQFVRLLNEINKLDKTRQGWEALLTRQFEEMKSIFTKTDKAAKDNMHKMLGAWQLMPMDTLQRTFSLTSVMPGDLFGDLKRDSLQEVTDKFLSIPGVGYTRESQEQIQEGIRLWNEYQNISQTFHQAMYKIYIDAIDAMRQKILDMSKHGKKIESLREIYDIWIDCNEEAYAAYVYTPEFSTLYGQLTNALMAVKQHGRNIVDEHLGALNVPTYRGINTLQKRQYDMKREQKAANKTIQTLQQEISTLQNQIKQSRSIDIKAPSPQKTRHKKTAAGRHAGTRRKKRSTAATSGKKTAKAVKKDNMILIKI